VQTLVEIDTCHCLMVSEPERLAHSPSTRLGDRLGCAAYRPSAPVALCAGCGQLAVLAAVGGQGGHRVHKPTPATTHRATCSPPDLQQTKTSMTPSSAVSVMRTLSGCLAGLDPLSDMLCTAREA
jgi:hypothetical protein